VFDTFKLYFFALLTIYFFESFSSRNIWRDKTAIANEMTDIDKSKGCVFVFTKTSDHLVIQKRIHTFTV